MLVEVRSVSELEQYFETGKKPRSAWRVGIEYEKPIVAQSSAEAVPYDGPTGVGRILEALRERTGWNGVYEGKALIALSNGSASITLEPGGQIEMSGAPFESLHGAADELRAHIADLLDVGDRLGVRFLGLGITPKTPLSDMPWMPKERYRIMRGIMERTGRLGHRMMQQTATVQANFDYSDQHDAHLKFRLAMALSPILVAMSANSVVVDGGLSPYKSFRAHIWTDTDAQRCGMLPFAFETQNLFGAYTRYALDVPMYFVLRSGRYLPSHGRSFREFLTSGIDGMRPTLDDWATHLTTLFPEARLKRYIELRSADNQPQDRVLALPAFMKGLLYEQDCLESAWKVLASWSLITRREAAEQAARHGLQGRVGRHEIKDYAGDLVTIALEGLRRQAARDDRGIDERAYLEPLAADVLAGLTQADRTIARWNADLRGDVRRMTEEHAYRA
jgi:glutamate--cysteine ligase